MTLADRRAALQKGRRWLRVILVADRTQMRVRRVLGRREIVLRVRLVGRRRATTPPPGPDHRAIRFY